ncbi:MBL fold metallo-hydrolase [Ramlibacter alkalitolerans]|uniref:MBL fold metallo-hydrolase n=1 Tax=Ramlibacter alkalitolerans TaxID=2039631 RepID=A0ABS1JJS7_9BURK|nr:MBL fold metallo-hydrolase [Ramlibacter alkalitolerans]
MIRFKSLGSGSSGNATVVQARSGAGAAHLLVDCGLGIRELDKRLRAAGMMADQIDAVFITHEHGDHIGCARTLALRERIPVYMSEGTYAAIGQPDFEGLLRLACDGLAFEVGAMQVRPFTVPHDAREPLQLTCTDGSTRLGVVTDLGHVTAHVLQELAGCATLLLECNHDEDLLRTSSYPAFLKRRVGGPYGHLANSAAAALAQAVLAAGALRQVVAGHLSEQNNKPELVRAALAQALNCASDDVHVADGPSGSGWLTA